MTLTERRQAAYDAAVARMHAATEAVDAAAADDTTTAEQVDALTAEATDAIADTERCRAALEDAQRLDRARAAHPVAPATPATTTDVRVVNDDAELLYRADRGSWFSDMYRARQGDTEAAARLQRHGAQQLIVWRDRGMDTQLRDVGTPAFAGLTVPQYLIDQFAPLARAGRPYANSVMGMQLPPAGMTLNISRLTTGTAVAVQATENAAVQETDADDTLLTINVRTYAGQQDVSRQALERSEGVDAVLYADLALAYHTALNSALLNADGTGGTHLGVRSTVGILAVTYTDASPTVAEVYPKLADAIQQVNTNRFLPATAILMHPRRWGWFTAALDTTNRPLVLPGANAPYNAVAVGQAAEYGQVVGTLHGLPVITDATIPTNLGAGTNEDMIFVYRAAGHMLWEEGDGMPRRLRFEETNGGNLSVKLVVYGYSAFTAGRYPAETATIGGTGLVTPTF